MADRTDQTTQSKDNELAFIASTLVVVTSILGYMFLAGDGSSNDDAPRAAESSTRR